MDKIKVAMCDDSEYLCVSIKNHFKYLDDLEFVGYTTDSPSCISLVSESKPDILLLDIQMESKTSGIDILPKLQTSAADLKIIMLTSYMDSTYIFDSLANGAADYVIKSCSTEELIQKIRDVYRGCNTIEPQIFNIFKQTSKNLSTAHKSLIYVMNKMISLSPNEVELLKALYNGESYSEIAQKRFVENTTVRSMGSRILRKFDCSNMHDLIQNLRDMKVFDRFSDL
jgi:DNA-binding NarL/FixJ family response regulator